MKDNFSKQAIAYSKYRPVYPNKLVEEIISFCSNKELAWDCACGNGQMSQLLSPYFNQVYASDISQKQLDQTEPSANIQYKLESCEACTLPNHSVDLITIAQALHWFNFDKFYKEAKRVLKPGGIIVAIGYGLLKINKELDQIIQTFYTQSIGSYWDLERKHVDNFYESIPFPFEPIEIENYVMKYQWTAADLIGYLNTWSAVQHFQKPNKQNPVELIEPQIKSGFHGAEKLEVKFPLFNLAGIN